MLGDCCFQRNFSGDYLPSNYCRLFIGMNTSTLAWWVSDSSFRAEESFIILERVG